MCRRGSDGRAILWLATWALVCGASAAPAQSPRAEPPVEDTPATIRDEAIEEYLQGLSLDDVLAAHLRERISALSPASKGGDVRATEQRLKAAESLGSLYVRMTTRAKTREERTALAQRSRELLDSVPEADSFELRLDMAKASYMSAEESAERYRLRLTSDDEVSEALRVLREVTPTLSSIGARLNERVNVLESREETAKDEDAPLIRAQLADGRRLRSLAHYYEGWARYYTALLSQRPAEAQEALQAFGTLLNAVPGKAPSIDRAPKNLMRYEHVARAAMGVSLSYSLMGDDVSALRWLDQLESVEDLPPPVIEQLFSRKLIAFIGGDRWTDVQVQVRRHRSPDRDDNVRLLTVPEARLLAVLCLERSRDASLRDGMREAASEMQQLAMGDLIARGELNQVVDLVRRYGTLPIGHDGFIVSYVRGLEGFESARERHKTVSTANANTDQPTDDPAAINAYRDAARLLRIAVDAEDATKFPDQRASASLRRGLALYYAGEWAPSADAFELAFSATTRDSIRQDALWYAIVSLDAGAERGARALLERRDRLATLYLRSFPGTENASRLILRQAGEGALSEQEALDILLQVPQESSLSIASRRQASRILFAMYKRAQPAEREFAAARFADIAEQVMRADFAVAMRPPAESTSTTKAATQDVIKDAAQSVVLRARQLADVLLAARVPDLPRVEAALDLLEQASSRAGMPLDALAEEVLFRRLQVALARSDDAQVQQIANRLQSAGAGSGTPSAFALAADRLLFQRSADVWRRDESDVRLAVQVVRFGLRLADAPKATQGLEVIREQTARAAASLWRAQKDEDMRRLAVRMDRAQLEAGARTLSSLRRLAELLEAGADLPGAMQAWNELLAGTDASTPEWYEARYQSLRLLALTDAAQAAAVFRQFELLHPNPAPEPWAERLQMLKDSLPAQPPTQAPAPTKAPTKGGGG
jgi:hypothetical protein